MRDETASERDEGVVLSQGRFRVDRKRALEKMERFQLEDPHRYVLELLAAAACAGAERVEIVNDSDDFVISFPLEPLSGDELDGLFDHLWGEPEVRRLATLQHLGLGVLGALGLGPRWVYVDSGDGDRALRLHVKDPTQTKHKDLREALSGVRVHVRERLSADTIAEALALAFMEPKEARLVRGAARRYPARLRINGQEVPQPEPPEVCVLRWAGELPGAPSSGASSPPRPAALFVVPHALDAGVDIVRHGLVVGHLPVPLGQLAVTGWLRDDALRLNASRSEIVRDERWTECAQALEAFIDAWLHQAAAPAADTDDAEELRWAVERDGQRLRFRATLGELRLGLVREAVQRLALKDLPLGALGELPILEDLHHQPFSASELRALGGPPAVTTTMVLDPEWTAPLFSAGHEQLLRAVCGDLSDVTQAIALMAEGRARRSAAKRVKPWYEDGRPQRRFSEGGQAGAVCAAAEDQRAGTVLLRLSVAGAEVEVRTLSAPGLRLQALLDDPELEPDVGFTRVPPQQRLDEGVKRVLREAEAFVCQQAAQASSPNAQREAASELIALIDVRLSGVHANPGPEAAREALGDALLNTPALPRLSGPRLSVRELLDADAPLYWLAEVPLSCPPELGARIVELPEQLAKRWARRFPEQLVDGTETVSANLKRARRLRAPRREAVVNGHYEVKVSVDEPGLRGELAWRPLAVSAPRESELLRGGVLVDALPLPEVMPNAFGVLDWPEAEVNLAHDSLLPGQLSALAARLLPHLDRLALAAWPEGARNLPIDVATWLRSPRIVDSPPEAALKRQIGRWTDGSRFTLGDLRRFARGRQKGEARLVVVQGDPGDLPGYEETVVLLPGSIEVVHAWAGEHVRDRDGDLAQSRWELARYLGRLQWMEPPSLARKDLKGPDWEGVAYLPVDLTELGPARAVALWQGRVLATRLRSKQLGAVVVVWGAAFKPTIKLDNVVDSKALTRRVELSQALLTELLDKALAPWTPPRAPAHEPAWRQLLACVASGEWRVGDRSTLLERLERLPLFPSLAGPILSATDLREADEQGLSVVLVPRDTPPGPADVGHHLLAVEGVAEAASAWLRRPLEDGLEALQDWRAAQRRIATSQRVSPKLTQPCVRQAPLDYNLGRGGEHEGEVGLGGQAEGLQLSPLADGIPLEPVLLPFPIPALAVAQGPAVRADRALRAVDEGAPGWGRLCEAALRQAHALAVELCQSARDDAERALARRWLLRAGGELPPKASSAELFERVDGSLVSLDALKQLEGAVGGVGAMSRGVTPRVRAWPEVGALLWVPAEEAADFSRRLKLRLLDDAVFRAGAGPDIDPPLPAASVTVPLEGWGRARIVIPFEPMPAAVTLRRGALTLGELRPTRLAPMLGTLDDPPLTLKPTWDGYAQDARMQQLQRALEDACVAALRRLAEGQRRLRQPAALPLLRSTLRLCCHSPQALREAAGGQAEGLAGELAALPLFERSSGPLGTLAEVCDGGVIRAVTPGRVGKPLPGSPSFWWLDKEERRWLALVFTVAQSDEVLAAEDRGAQRRGGPLFDKDLPAWSSLTLSREVGPLSAALWLGEEGGDGVRVLIHGREVCAHPAPVPGLRGWIEGPFEANAAFTQAPLTADAEALLQQAAEELVQQEARGSAPDRLRLLRRMRAVLGSRTLRKPGSSLERFLDAAPVDDLDGRPVTVRDLINARSTNGKLYYLLPRQTVTEDFAALKLVLRLSTDEADVMRSLLGGEQHLLSAVDAMHRQGLREAQREAKEKEKAEAAEARALEATSRASANAIRAHLKAWSHKSGAELDGEPVLEGWVKRGAPRWVQVSEVDSPALAVAAWQVAADSGASNEAELALIGELVRVLGG